MSAEVLAYPFLFLAIFFESFILVTFLSKPAKAARGRVAATDDALPSVAIIVPCFNEARTVGETVKSLLGLSYPAHKLEVILVDDGSTDETPGAMAAFAEHPQIKIVRKENGGKHTALNTGIALTNASIVGCLDADSFVEPSALREMISSFGDPQTAASTGAMSVHQPENLLQHMQNAEYIFGIILRHTLASINGIYVTPGPFSLYRREIILQLGGFRKGHQTEDLEMALRIQKAGYAIENAPRARVYTKAPKTVLKLIKQRTRWTTGFMRNVLHEYRDLVGNRKFGALGTVVLPLGIVTIFSSMLLFGFALFQFLKHVAQAVSVRVGIPVSYSLSAHGHLFDWFYFPTNLYLFLGAIAILCSVSMIAVGKNLSKTPGSLGMGIFSYVFLYGLIAPLWLFRASTDVALHKTRSWR